MAAADRHLLFGLLALQNGIINQGQLLAAFQAWTQLVELHGQSVTIDDREIEPDVVANRHRRDGKAAILNGVFEARAALSAGREDGQGFAAERVDDVSGVDAAAAGRVFAGKNIGAVVECEPIHEDRPVNGRIHGQGNDQLSMVAQES